MTAAAVPQLLSALRGAAPAANPATPNTRTDYSVTKNLDYQRVRVSVQRAIENEQDPIVQRVFNAVAFMMDGLLRGTDGATLLSDFMRQLPPAPPAMPPMGAPQGFPPAGAPGQMGGFGGPPPGPGPAAGGAPAMPGAPTPS